jgi:type III pantothenate kinase
MAIAPEMSLVAVDIGNTSIKLGWFDAAPLAGWPAPDRLLAVSTRDMTSWRALETLPPRSANWVVGTVHREAEQQLARWVAHARPGDRYRKLTNADLPIRIDVDFPERVGTDRLLAATGASALRDPSRPAIVIDAGSAVTVDLVAADGSFQGGVIWPGRAMMAEALAGSTDALPLITAPLESGPPEIIGKSTEKALKSGLFWGNVGAIREFITQMRRGLDGEPEVFVTGGDAQRLARLAFPEARQVAELVLAGIVLAWREAPP